MGATAPCLPGAMVDFVSLSWGIPIKAVVGLCLVVVAVAWRASLRVQITGWHGLSVDLRANVAVPSRWLATPLGRDFPRQLCCECGGGLGRVEGQ